MTQRELSALSRRRLVQAGGVATLAGFAARRARAGARPAGLRAVVLPAVAAAVGQHRHRGGHRQGAASARAARLRARRQRARRTREILDAATARRPGR